MTEKSVAEKLMIKTGQRVRFVNAPADLPALLGGLPDGALVLNESAGAGQLVPAEVIIVFANNRTEMVALLPGLRKALAPNGMIWIAYHKGTSPVKTDIHRDSINAYAHTLGMQAVALISVNDDWSALRLKVDEGKG